MQKRQEKDIREKLVQWGYTPSADCTPEEFKEGIYEYQKMYKDLLDDFAFAKLHREAVPDGEVGPASELLFELPRCNCPDFSTGIDGEEIAKVAWPPSCRDITVSYQFDQIRATWLKQAWQDALESWNDVIDTALTLISTNGRNGTIWATDSPLSGSTLAWSMVGQGRCNQRAEQRYNTRINWSKQYLQAVVAHEVGHALGSGHLRSQSALMYPYARVSIYLPQATDVRHFRGMGYGKPNPKPNPDPVPGAPEKVTVFFGGKSLDYFPEGSGSDKDDDWTKFPGDGIF